MERFVSRVDMMEPVQPVTVLFGSDHERPMSGVPDLSAREGAEALRLGLERAGYRTRLLDLWQEDLLLLTDHGQRHRPKLIFNLVESLQKDTRRHPWVADALEGLGLRYTGATGPVLTRCLFKDRAKRALTRAGVRTPQACLLQDADGLSDRDIPLPGFVKLVHEDASIGVTEANVVYTVAEARARARVMIEEFRQPVLIERYVEGREINVAVLGSGAQSRALPLREIDFSAMPVGRPRIVSFAAKWDEDHVDYGGTVSIPVRPLSDRVRRAIEQTALRAYRALGLRDYGRVDLRVDDRGVPWVIDVNPNCDLSEDAGFARSARMANLTYPALLSEICGQALARGVALPVGHPPEVASSRLRRAPRG